MRNLTVGVFEHLSITSSLDVYVRMKYIEIILKVSALRKFKHVMVFLKEKGKEEGGDNWTMVEPKYVSMEEFW